MTPVRLICGCRGAAQRRRLEDVLEVLTGSASDTGGIAEFRAIATAGASLITAPRTTSWDIRRHKASNYD